MEIQVSIVVRDFPYVLKIIVYVTEYILTSSLYLYRIAEYLWLTYDIFEEVTFHFSSWYLLQFLKMVKELYKRKKHDGN